MTNCPQRVLLCFALFLLACGFTGFALSGFDPASHFHGVRFAMVVGIAGLIVGRLRRQRAFAIMTVDFCALLLLALGANYFRLTWKWFGISGNGWYMPWLAAIMGSGSFFTLWALLRARPRRQRSDWWMWSPLLSLPMVLTGFSRRRHGLNVGRRAMIAMGLCLLMGGFVLSNGARLSNTSVATAIDSARLMSRHETVLKQLLSDPQSIDEIIRDPRARSLIAQVSSEVGISDGTTVQAAIESAAEGDLHGAIRKIEEEGVTTTEVIDAVAGALADESSMSGGEGAAASASESDSDSSPSAKDLVADPIDTIRAEASQVMPDVMHSISDQEITDVLSSLPGGAADENTQLTLEEARDLARKMPPGGQSENHERRSQLIQTRIEPRVEPSSRSRSIPAAMLPSATDGYFEHGRRTVRPPWPQRDPPRGWTAPEADGPAGVPAEGGEGALPAAVAGSAAAEVERSVMSSGSENPSDRASPTHVATADATGVERAAEDAASGVAKAVSAEPAIDREALSSLVADAVESFSDADHDLSVARAKLISQYSGIAIMLLGVTLLSVAMATRRSAPKG